MLALIHYSYHLPYCHPRQPPCTQPMPHAAPRRMSLEVCNYLTHLGGFSTSLCIARVTLPCRMSLEVCNYISYLDSASFRHPLYLQSFGWLTVVGLAFQASWEAWPAGP